MRAKEVASEHVLKPIINQIDSCLAMNTLSPLRFVNGSHVIKNVQACLWLVVLFSFIALELYGQGVHIFHDDIQSLRHVQLSKKTEQTNRFIRLKMQ